MELLQSIRVIVADDHRVVRGGLKSIFEGTEITVVAEANTGEEVVALVNSQAADLVILDVRMDGHDGISALSRIKMEAPDIPVLVFSAFENPVYLGRAVALGAAGYLLKTSDRNRILSAVRSVAGGETLWSPLESRRLNGSAASGPEIDNLEFSLTHREFDVLREMTLGKTNKQIAGSIGIGYETVKEHVQNILRKLGVADRTQAAVLAVRKGIF